MNCYTLKDRIVFLKLKSLGGVLAVLVVIYRDVPGIPLALCSVHSRITCTRLPFAFFAILLKMLKI